MAAIPHNIRRVVGVLTVLLLGLFGVVWVGANPVGGGVLIALSVIRLVMLVRELGGDAKSEALRARLADLDKEIAEVETRPRPSGPGAEPKHRGAEPNRHGG